MAGNDRKFLPAVCDAGPLIHLGEIGHAGLLHQFHPLWIPRSVMSEARTFQAPSELRYEIIPVDDISRRAAMACFQGKLDAGETDALALCLNKDRCLLLTDDLAARREAERVEIPVHGSVGVVVRAYKVGTISLEEADRALGALADSRSLFVSRAIIECGRRQLRNEAHL